MDQFYESGVYQHMIRSPEKSLKHCCTGQTELQRISKDVCYKNLQYSLTHSKMLKRLISEHPLDQKFNEEVFEQLCHIKNISNEQNKFYVRKIIKQYQCYRYSMRKIDEIKKQKYNKSNDEHQKLLLQLWDNLMPKHKLQNRISNQWIDVGFQANDPATDFRGAGYLGLLNLVFFSRDKKCRAVFQWAINQETSYFFCSAGLFFTMTAVQIAKQMIVPVDLWVFDSQKEIIKKFQSIYTMLFMEFDEFWKTCKNKTILQFNNNLLKFKSNIKALDQRTIKEKVMLWDNV